MSRKKEIVDKLKPTFVYRVHCDDVAGFLKQISTNLRIPYEGRAVFDLAIERACLLEELAEIAKDEVLNDET